MWQKRLFEEDEPKAIGVKQDMNLEEAESIAKKIMKAVEHHCERIEIVGSIRRRKKEVRDIDYVVVVKEEKWKAMRKMLEEAGTKIEAGGDKIMRTFIPFDHSFVQVDFYRCPATRWGITMLIRTGSAEHNVHLAELALRKGMRLRYSKGLCDKEDRIIASRDEKSIFKCLGLPYITPRMRELIKGRFAWE